MASSDSSSDSMLSRPKVSLHFQLWGSCWVLLGQHQVLDTATKSSQSHICLQFIYFNSAVVLSARFLSMLFCGFFFLLHLNGYVMLECLGWLWSLGLVRVLHTVISLVSHELVDVDGSCFTEQRHLWMKQKRPSYYCRNGSYPKRKKTLETSGALNHSLWHAVNST